MDSWTHKHNAEQAGREAARKGLDRRSSYAHLPYALSWYHGYDDEKRTMRATDEPTQRSPCAREAGRNARRFQAQNGPANCNYQFGPMRNAWVEGYRESTENMRGSLLRASSPAFHAGRDAYNRGRKLNTSWPADIKTVRERDSYSAGWAFAKDQRLTDSIELTTVAEITRTTRPCISHEFSSLYLQHLGRAVRPTSIAELSKEKDPMNATFGFVFASLLPDVISVTVKFTTHGTTYTYKGLKSQNIAAGDKVVVDSPNSGLTVVDVVAVGDFAELDAGAYQGYKWIAGRVDMGDYTDITTRETKFKERIEELRRDAKRKAALAKLAEELGGMDALTALIAEVKGEQGAPASSTEGQG